MIPQREYFDKDIANSDNTSGYYIIEENDFVYNPRKSTDAPYGPISSYKYAEAGIVSPLYLCFRAKKEINPAFFEWYSVFTDDGVAIYPVAEKTPTADPEEIHRIHTVVRGDTLYEIAKAYLADGSRYREIKTLNGLTSNTIYIGMKLKIPN